MKIVLAGGSGHVGALLARVFHEDGHEVVVLSRTERRLQWRVVTWDAKSSGAWAGELEGADAVVNLVGRSVNCRYDAENRRQIKESPLPWRRLLLGFGCRRARRPFTRTGSMRPMTR
jgi:uncharacterized protein